MIDLGGLSGKLWSIIKLLGAFAEVSTLDIFLKTGFRFLTHFESEGYSVPDQEVAK